MVPETGNYMIGFRFVRPAAVAMGLCAAVWASLLLDSGSAQAQIRPVGDYYQLQTPGHFGATLLASGFGSDQYGATHESVELGQTITRTIGVVGRIIAYQVYNGDGYDTPIDPVRSGQQFNFGRGEGGIDLRPIEGTTLRIFGGHDFGDSNAPVVDGDFSSWMGLHSTHPVNVSFTGSHYYNNGKTGGSVDFRAVALSSAELLFVAGAGGQIWGGGQTAGVKGEGGLDLGALIRRWHLEVDLQGGYGVLHIYGIVGVSRHFDFTE
ncbi:MAG TPA: hypothetical protein VGI47_03070 [Candidatus Binataceae bacterium]